MESVKFDFRLKKYLRVLSAAVLLTSSLSYATSPNTDNPNLGFESGTTENWIISNGTGTSKGATTWSSNGAGVNTTTGITNYSPGGGKTWTVTPYGNHMMAIQAGSGSPNFDPAATALGLTTSDVTDIRSYLTGLGGNSSPTNASWAKRSVTLQAGTTYTIAWQYMSTDYTPFNDGSMMTVVHSTDATRIPTLNNETRRYALLGFTNPGTGNYATDSYGSTGWQLATIRVPVDGTYTLGFSSFNLGDTALSPILLVDDLQGTTLLNGQPFAPIDPNPGSSAPSAGDNTAPTLCCGGSADPFSANAAFNSRVTAFSAGTVDNKIFIQQLGNNNIINVAQSGAGKKSVEVIVSGSSNQVNTTQTSNSALSVNYMEIAINGSNNIVENTQNNSGGAKSNSVMVNNNNNQIDIWQKDSGNHYAEISVSGSAKNITLTQEGSAAHMARIELSGGATGLTATQSGPTQQFYSITHHCAQTSCADISVTQGTP